MRPRIDFFTYRKDTLSATMIQGLLNAAKKRNFHVELYPFSDRDSKEYIQRALKDPPLFTCSVAQVRQPSYGLTLQVMGIPHFYFSTDLGIYSEPHLEEPLSYLSLPCKLEREVLKKNHKDKKILFLPQAVDQEYITHPPLERIYEAVFLGSCFDHQEIEVFWNSSFDKKTVALFKEIASKIVSEPNLSLSEEIKRLSHFNDTEIRDIAFSIESYCRNRTRCTLLASLDTIKIDLFGTGPWEKYLHKCKHITIHPSIYFKEATEVIKRSKLLINSAPCLKAGIHERILYGLGAGTLVLSDRNAHVQKEFSEEMGLIGYTLDTIDAIKERLPELLKKRSEDLGQAGKKHILHAHTWDHRFTDLLQALFPANAHAF